MDTPDRDLRLLFIGDIVGGAGLDLLEAELPALRARLRPDFVVANAENASLTGENAVGGAGMTREDVARLRVLGVDAITGGNHSWDSAEAVAALQEPEVVRPLNVTGGQPGRGALVIARGGVRLGVVSLASATAMPHVEPPYEALTAQLEQWGDDAVDLLIVDFHGESVSEKQIFAWSVAGRVAAVLGTHTHVPTLDDRVLPGGTAYVSDVGMTGPGGGMQGYAPDVFIDAMRQRRPVRGRGAFAQGPAELGAVLVRTHGGRAVEIERVSPQR
jgi:metallophosphoesterase (TIGR00282 family)